MYNTRTATHSRRTRKRADIMSIRKVLLRRGTCSRPPLLMMMLLCIASQYDN